jgi:hypothetical protein
MSGFFFALFEIKGGAISCYPLQSYEPPDSYRDRLIRIFTTIRARAFGFYKTLISNNYIRGFQ